MKEDDNILKRVGRDNPFKVPDGYFDHLTDEIMNNLPEKQSQPFAAVSQTPWQRVRPWLYVAAVFAGAAFIIRVASSSVEPTHDTDRIPVSDVVQSDEAYFDNVVENSLLEDYALYEYLADAE